MADIFKQPPKAKSRTKEYKPPQWKRIGDEWIIGDWPRLQKDFDLADEELTHWHEVVVGQGRYWQIVRLLYLVRDVLYMNEDAADFLRAWSLDDIAKKIGQPTSLIETELEQIILHWKQRRHEKTDDIAFESKKPAAPASAHTAPVATAPEQDREQSPTVVPLGEMQDKVRDFLPKFKHQKISDDDARSIIDALSLGEISDPELRQRIAIRAMGFQQWLEKPITRENACQILRHEINLAQYQSQLHGINKSLMHEKDSTKITALNKEYRDVESRYAALTIIYQSQLDELGGELAVREDMKRMALDNLGFITQAIRKYRADGSRDLIDGVFTADEINWLLTPIPLRPVQYRPDVVVMIRDAMRPENLFDPKYKPPKITREVCRKLNRMLQIFESEIGVNESKHAEIEAPMQGDDESSSVSSAPPVLQGAPTPYAPHPDAVQPSYVPAAFSMTGRSDDNLISVSPS